jgi:3-dehydroquinate synthase
MQWLVPNPFAANAEAKPRAWKLSVAAHMWISYEITHTPQHVFSLVNPTLAELVGLRPALVVVDNVILDLYGSTLVPYITERLLCEALIGVEGSESHKSWEHVDRICGEAVRCGLRRDGVMIGVGGGTVLDCVGLAASLYRRGTRFIRIPTTLVGLVDVSVGIKQAINFKSKKNALGTFFPPYGCINDVTFLRTLPFRHLACGIAEILKMAMVRDAKLFDLVLANAPALLRTHFECPADAAAEILVRAESAMLDELQPNLFEHNLRRLVDFGHTFSPALEAASGYQLPHGEAVALDMLLSTSIAVECGMCRQQVLTQLLEAYLEVGLPIAHPLIEPGLVGSAMQDARAHRGGDLNLVLPMQIGQATFVQNVKTNTIVAAIDRMARVSERAVSRNGCSCR